MPLRKKTIDFDEEIKRLESRREELLEQAATLESGNPELQRLQSEGQTIDDRLAGVRWARDEAFDDSAVSVWDEDVDEIILGGLTGREYGKVEDELGSAASERGVSLANGTARIYLVARGTVSAPYVDGYDETEELAATGELPRQFLAWAEAHIDDLSTVGGSEGNEKPFSAALAEKRRTMSADEQS
ncbi:hypothetical protein [Halobellus rubicundus]|uniref:Uncharacterized protein n=1 Tax=Halobellus rubicundus TaxID=2996466 RepID=A0ABD5MDS6_9EURY